MANRHVSSTKPVSRKQADNLLRSVAVRLERNKNLYSVPFQRASKKHRRRIVDECVAVIVKYHDAVGDIIRVDRSTPITYPDWVEKPLHPELEQVGPAEFDMSEVEEWLHDGQKQSVVRGQVIYDHLEKNDMLKTCVGLPELQAIQKLGIAFFRRHFAGKRVYGYRSAVRARDGHSRAPDLVERDGEVVLRWYWLGYDWNALEPALRFRK
jgi:hypothetical protein